MNKTVCKNGPEMHNRSTQLGRAEANVNERLLKFRSLVQILSFQPFDIMIVEAPAV